MFKEKKACLGGGGPTTTASKVSSINIEGDKVMMRETGPGGGGGLTPDVDVDVSGDGDDQPDQSVRRSGGLYGLLKTGRVKLQGSGTFIQKSTNKISVRLRVAEIEGQHHDKVNEGRVGFGFLKTVEGRNPFLSVDSPTKRRRLETETSHTLPHLLQGDLNLGNHHHQHQGCHN